MNKRILVIILLAISIKIWSQCSVNITAVNPKCNASCDGVLTAVPTGGTSPYSYVWSTSGMTEESISGLCVGTYTVQMTDAVSCITTTVITLISPSPLTVSVTPTNVSCYGTSNGSATAIVSGGSPNYSYIWNTLPIETAPTAFNLSPGTYQVNIYDINNCKDSATVTINEPPLIVLSPVSTQSVTCNGGNNGSAAITASGGVPGYTYLWTPGSQTTSMASNLAADNYTVTVSDTKACTKTQLFTIFEPIAISVDAHQTDLNSCFGSSAGKATVTTSGGTGTYTYNWAVINKTTQSVSGLTAGTYTVQVRDQNNCIETDTAELVFLTPLSGTITAAISNCGGNNNGIASIQVSGSLPSYSYLWSNNNQTTSSISGLTTGSYSVIVTDNASCTALFSASLTQAAPITSSVTTQSSCGNSNNGSASVSALGGVPAYSYQWSTNPIQQTAIATGLIPGTYSVTITDIGGCTKVDVATIGNNANPVISVSQNNNDCYGSADGSANVIVSGASPFSYSWTGIASSATSVSNLTAGNYAVLVTDANNCIATSSITITEPLPFSISPQVINASCTGCSDGAASVTISGATSPYTYLWSNGRTNAFIGNLIANTYTICITDANNCDTCIVLTVSEPTSIASKQNETPYLKNHPNPFSNSLNIVFDNDKIAEGVYVINIRDVTGKIFIQRSYSKDQLKNIILDTSIWPDGIYILELSTENFLYSKKIFKLFY